MEVIHLGFLQYDVSDLGRKVKIFLFYDLSVLDDIDGYIVVNKA